jgi:signal transduction histidine kinase
VLSILRLDLEQRGVTAEVRLAVALPPVLGDRLLIEQVLFNLVRNACEAMAGNAEADRRLLIETVIAEGVADGMAELRVYDLGTGLTHDPEQLFQPFFTTKAEGVGIGLVICRSIIEAHDGQIGAFANRPRGACFWIRLPLATDAPAAMTTESA